MAGRLTIILFVVFSVVNASLALDLATENSLRTKIRKLIDEDFTLLPGLVRLAFHQCVGKRCNGCIDFRNADNAGMETYVDKTEELYQKQKKNGKLVLSRADFWALGGAEAIAYASELGTCRRCRVEYPKIKFRTGRQDCSGSPKGSPFSKDNKKFPDPLGTTLDTTSFFRREFNFSDMETVAIMGAHSLGMAHRSASGFQGPWVERRFRLDNAYYKELLNANNNWTNVRIGPPRFSKWQWVSRGSDVTKMMLNCDMSLLKNLTKVSSTGQVRGCKYRSCALVSSKTSNTATWVKKYAKDNSLFLKNFGRAFQKMINKGYTNLKDVMA